MHIIFGSSSGIGLALAQELHRSGVELELLSHRKDGLEHRFGNSPPKISFFDGLDSSSFQENLAAIFSPERYISTVSIVFGTGHLNPALDPKLEIETIQLNALAFTAVASHAVQHFISQGHGTLVGISSVAAVRGSAHAPAYNASKALVATYLEGLRLLVAKKALPVQITEIRPGFVDTAMMRAEKAFWVVSTATAAKAILSAVEKRKTVAYVPRRWQLIAIILRLLPEFLYKKL